jgi:hypothetical protein
MRPALWSVVIQATGSAATLGAALLVASTMGLAAQGQFGLLRSWSDALVTVAVLGLPQGLLHLQYRESVPVAALRGWVVRYVLGVAVVLALLIAAALVLLPAAPIAGAFTPATLAVMVAAVPLAAAHLLWRSLALRDVGPVPYAAITAAPALLIFAALVPVCLIGHASAMVWALFAGAALSAVLSGLVVRAAVRSRAPGDAARPWSRATLWSIGIETGVQGVLTALSPALVLSIAGWAGAPLAELGAVSLGLHVYQLFGVAAAYIAPMVYDRAAATAQPLTTDEIVARVRAAVTPMRSLLGVTAAVIALIGVRWAWPAGADSLALLSLMAVAGALSMGVRLLVTLMLARGAFRPLTIQALVRLVTATGATALLLQRLPATLAVPLALAATEILLLCWLARALQHGAEPEAAGR